MLREHAHQERPLVYITGFCWDWSNPDNGTLVTRTSRLGTLPDRGTQSPIPSARQGRPKGRSLGDGPEGDGSDRLYLHGPGIRVRLRWGDHRPQTWGLTRNQGVSKGGKVSRRIQRQGGARIARSSSGEPTECFYREGSKDATCTSRTQKPGEGHFRAADGRQSRFAPRVATRGSRAGIGS